MSIKNVFKNKKVLWSTVGAGATGVGAVAGGVAGGLSNQQSIQQESTVDANVVNDAAALDKFNSDYSLLIDKATNEALSKALNSNVLNEIKDSMLSNKSNFDNVTLDFVSDSVNYNEKESTFIFNATPVDGHGWEDGNINTKKVLVVLTNVKVNSESNEESKPEQNPGNSVLKDALTLNDDIFAGEVLVEDATSDALEKAILNKEQEITKAILNNPSYANVKLTYKSYSANLVATNLNDSSAVFTVTPVDGHAWVDGTTSSKELKVRFDNINISLDISQNIDYALPNYTTFESYSRAINYIFELGGYDFGGQKRIPTYIESNYPNIKVNKLVSAKLVSRNTAVGVYSVTPIDGYKWRDGSRETKNVSVTVTNFVINIVEAPKAINYSLPGFVTYDSNEMALDAIFSTGGYHGKIDQVKNYIEQKVECVKVTRLISKQLVNDHEAVAVYGIQPIDGFLWADGGNAEKQITVHVDNFLMNTITVANSLNYTLDLHGVYDSADMALNAIFQTGDYDLGQVKRIPQFIENTYKNVKVNKLVSTKLVSNTEAVGIFEITPVSGYKWFDNSTGPKQIEIHVTNFEVK